MDEIAEAKMQAKVTYDALIDIGRVTETPRQWLLISRLILGMAEDGPPLNRAECESMHGLLLAAFWPSDASKGPDTPPKPVEAGSGAPSGFVGSVSVAGGGVNVAGLPVAGPAPKRAFLPPDANREGHVCGDCTLCMDAPPGRDKEVCPLIDEKPTRGPGIIPPGNLVGDMKPEPKPERTCGEYRGGHYYEPCPPGDIACSEFKPKAGRRRLGERRGPWFGRRHGVSDRRLRIDDRRKPES